MRIYYSPTRQRYFSAAHNFGKEEGSVSNFSVKDNSNLVLNETVVVSKVFVNHATSVYLLDSYHVGKVNWEICAVQNGCED